MREFQTIYRSVYRLALSASSETLLPAEAFQVTPDSSPKLGPTTLFYNLPQALLKHTENTVHKNRNSCAKDSPEEKHAGFNSAIFNVLLATP